MKTPITTLDAPAALGPYSQAIMTGSTLYISGQLGIDPVRMKFVNEKCVKAQTERALINIQNILAKAGTFTIKNVVNCTLLLTSMDDFDAVNEVYAKFFPPVKKEGDVPPPARVCFAVKALPKNALVEIAAVAHIE